MQTWKWQCVLRGAKRFWKALDASGSRQWRWAILCDHLEVNKSQSSTKLFIFGSAFPILHKVPTKPVWAGSTAQLSNTAHKLIQSCSAMYLCKMVFFLHTHRSSPVGIGCSTQTPVFTGLCWCSSFPWVSCYARFCSFLCPYKDFSFSSTSHLFLLSFVFSYWVFYLSDIYHSKQQTIWADILKYFC